MTRLRNMSELQVKRFLWVFYAIGLLGLGLPFSRTVFIYLMPLNILISFVVLLISDRSDQKGLLPLAVLIFAFGYIAGVIGANTGFPFGELSFGKSLGPKLFGAPMLLGWKWLMLAYCSTVIVSKITENRYFISFLATILMVVFDMVLEGPAAMLDLWSWARVNVPMQNFLSWFFISWIINGAIQLKKFKLENPVAGSLYAAQFTFFLILNVIFFIEQGI